MGCEDGRVQQPGGRTEVMTGAQGAQGERRPACSSAPALSSPAPVLQHINGQLTHHRMRFLRASHSAGVTVTRGQWVGSARCGNGGVSVSAGSYGLHMATADDVRRLALSLPGALEKLVRRLIPGG